VRPAADGRLEQPGQELAPAAFAANETPVKILAVDRSLRAFVHTTAGNIYLCGGMR